MRLPASLLLSAFIGAVSAFSDASVYIFQQDQLSSTSAPTPTLTPQQARLVFAQRLGASKYHDLGDSSDETLSYINTFGGQTEMLFQDQQIDKAAELVLIVEGISSKSAAALLATWSSSNPTFKISDPPSMSANKRLVQDLYQQSGQNGRDCAFAEAINPLDTTCWIGKSKIVHHDLAEQTSTLEDLIAAQKRLVRFTEKKKMNVVLVLMPESSRSLKSPLNPYGTYEVDRRPIGRRQSTEEPMTEEDSMPTSLPQRISWKQVQNSENSSLPPITGVPPLCYNSVDSCMSSTYNCSGHGECFKKYGSGEGACFTCGCQATNDTITNTEGKVTGWTMTYWGGSACHKRDISSPFWLITISSVVLVGIVSWGIGLLFSIGEEKLPGVIGAGVSSKSR